MTEMSSYSPGTFCWIDLTTTDGAGAKKFYGQLFGWSMVDTPIGPDMVYTMGQIEGKDVAGLYQQGPQEQGIPPHWNSYVSAASAADIVTKAKAAGGTALMEADDVMSYGRMAIIQDPTGGIVGVWEPGSHIGARLVNQPGALCWNELATRDALKAADFYAQVFGWQGRTQPIGNSEYTTFYNGENMSAGMIQMTEEWGDIPPHWLVYFAVEDCDSSADSIKSLGGNILVAPNDIPSVGRFAVAQDPQGAAFAIIQLTMPA